LCVIEQAKGVLVERLALSLDEAFELLSRSARSSGRKIHDVAREVVESRETPADVQRHLDRS
jgi:AmiR/NasT family two-component response regulator